METRHRASLSMPRFALWDKLKAKRAPLSFDLEVTNRCHHNCSHCYINLPAGELQAAAGELSREEILDIARQAAGLGSVWCLLTGGEPLLRADFFDLYLGLKRLGLLVSVFTNASLITREHAELFHRYPPRDLEVTVYGVTAETYERVTRRPGSFAAFRRGLGLLLDLNVKVRLKAMALRDNVHELPAIARFCREHGKDYFRFDPFLHLRFDGDIERNAEIRGQRLNPEEIVALEAADPERWPAWQKECAKMAASSADTAGDYLFQCGAGLGSFVVGADGRFRLCSSLWHPECLYDLRQGSLREAWEQFVPQVRERRSQDPVLTEKCRSCPLVNVCFWCPAHAHLETGRLDAWVEYFCRVAQTRVQMLKDQPASPPLLFS